MTMSMDAAIADGEEMTMSFADVLPSSDMSPAEMMERSDNEEIISKAMKSLPKDYAQIMEMRVGRELSYEEIAQQLNLSIGTVKSRIARARECLRDKLEKLL